MREFLLAAGIVWIILGLAVFGMAKSAIHEILACLAVSFGLMFWAFSAIIKGLHGVQSEIEKSREAAQARADSFRPMPPPMPGQGTRY